MKKCVFAFAALGALLLGVAGEARAAGNHLQCTLQCDVLYPPILVPPPEGVKPQHCTTANPSATGCKLLCKYLANRGIAFTTLGCQQAVTALCGGATATKKCVEAGYTLCDALALGT
jgi:hypothetical protein